MTTGTRTQVTATGRSGRPRILRVSSRTSISSDDQPSSRSDPGPGHDVERDRRGEGPGLLADGPAHVTGAVPSSVPATRDSCSRSVSTPARPSPLTAWYEETTSSRSPNSACSAPTATIIDRVVQLGLATMPRGRIAHRVRVDLGDDERHVGVHAEGARVVHDDRALGGGDRRPPRGHLVGHVEHGDVDAVEDVLGERDAPRSPPRARPACCRPSAERRSVGSRPRRPRAGTGSGA